MPPQLVKLGLRASAVMHESLLKRIIRAPSCESSSHWHLIIWMQEYPLSPLRTFAAFFDVTPVGRILNRFSKDQDTVDMVLNQQLTSVLRFFFALAALFLVMSVTAYWLLLLFVPAIVLYFVIQQYYRHTSREVQRLDSISRSPIFQVRVTYTCGGYFCFE